MNPEKIISAQVVLAAASGARPGPETRITSDNIEQWTPSPESVGRVKSEFRELGFEVGECVGNSMSITGPAKLFESSFDMELTESPGGVEFAGGGPELPAAKVPETLRSRIAAITFVPPPEFGPGGEFGFM